MVRNALARRRVEGIGEGSLLGTLSSLLTLTSEAVLVFDGFGRILLANESASEVFLAAGPLVGSDVRGLFSTSSVDAGDAFSVSDLPFPVDGSSALVASSGREACRLRVRCASVQAPGETYLLVAMPANEEDALRREYERTIGDLRRANHRLSGAFNIVLDTIDTEDMTALLERLLDKIAETMEADGTIVYFAQADGFHLWGYSSGLEGERMARFMAFDRSVERLAIREGHAVRLRVCAPSGGALRQGRLTARDVVNEETREVMRLKCELLPPFTSFVVVPVWFGGHVISIIEVGWKRMHPLLKDDAMLLDSVAHYLAVQLAGAFTALRSRRADRLASFGSELREELLSAGRHGEAVDDRLAEVLVEAADELEAALVCVRHDAQRDAVVADLPLTGTRELPADVAELVGDASQSGAPGVIPVPPGSEGCRFLRGLGEPCVGALLDFGELGGERVRHLLLRPDGAEPFDELELEFLARLVEDARDISLGVEALEQDKRIAQALQTGMRNELQKVPGISSEAVYSSATATAFVGGDFYDLINLPGRRACVIMGDVSGKGVEAASVSAAVKTALAAYVWQGLSPARMVRMLNEFLLSFSRVETFATLFVGVVDLAEGTITYCSAGHPPAILIRRTATEISILDVQSGVVGAFHDINYQDGVTRLGEGDVLLLYTDGTTEARSPSGAFFGEQGLRDTIMRESGPDKTFEGFADRLLATLDAFTGRSLDDDVAIVALRFDEIG